ncbi:MAG: hypothetical protein EZS28_005000 [Streblomastix strix]|uniref:Uncharacterized protein n=1 Tax=Streblomastix strix TaxID=222440 RepID=A0A5J4WY28_9EUKA|nr:MAG: hypothetical protein EZS28_005000 [Streblomastix strix]
MQLPDTKLGSLILLGHKELLQQGKENLFSAISEFFESWISGSEIFLRSLTATITIASNRVEFSGPISGMQQNQIPLWEKTTGAVEEQDVFLQRAIISAPLHSAWVPAYGFERIESDLFRSFQGQPHQFRISSPFGSGDYENKIQRSANLPQPTGQILNAGASVQSIDFANVDDNLIEFNSESESCIIDLKFNPHIQAQKGIHFGRIGKNIEEEEEEEDDDDDEDDEEIYSLSGYPLRTLRFSPFNPRLIASAGHDSQIYIVDTDGGRSISYGLEDNTYRIVNLRKGIVDRIARDALFEEKEEQEEQTQFEQQSKGGQIIQNQINNPITTTINSCKCNAKQNESKI